jgi:hypothetical protein
MIWALNGMRHYLTGKLEALVKTYYVASGLLPLPSDEFIIKAQENRNNSWAGVYAVKKRIAEYSEENTVMIRIVVTELEWEAGVTGFSYEHL